jgi:hypothetical protein
MAQVAHEPGPGESPEQSDELHVLFVPGVDQYRLIERKGVAPAAGEVVRVSGGARFRVIRVGPSPLPGHTVPCVYLEQLL